ncbi:hypothetical protein AB7008_11830 [Bradyrhizobium sp. 521_C7_N1_3]|uniref:hypothetical protein n=1 Tax=Bradyrhizobium TaxID=374 RepID=UPI002714D6DB|nr:hypothetical protein [Bradyrhizobium japonicum]WLB52393.1 hypothetical protein QIH94_34280 [Bradyrhizobium japonicum]WLB65756.1 hypothetical protein QIH96_11625 [Bradyrhizobium japonicum]
MSMEEVPIPEPSSRSRRNNDRSFDVVAMKMFLMLASIRMDRRHGIIGLPKTGRSCLDAMLATEANRELVPCALNVLQARAGNLPLVMDGTALRRQHLCAIRNQMLWDRDMICFEITT